MKVFVILPILIVFILFSANNTYGYQQPKSSYNLYYENELIVKGTIISFVNDPLNKELKGYNVKVMEQYSRPKQTFNLITAFATSDEESFDVNDTVLLYLNKLDSLYTISPYSFKIPKNCEGLSFTGLLYLPWQDPPRSAPTGTFPEIFDVQGNQEHPLDTDIRYNVKTDKFWYEPTDQLDMEVIIQNTDSNEIIFQERKTHYGEPCNWKDIQWPMTLDKEGHYSLVIIKHKQLFADYIIRPLVIQAVEFSVGIDDDSLSAYSVVNPSLKVQSGVGVPIVAIQCKEGLELIQKYDGTPACVTESTKTKLVERGWAKQSSLK